MAGEVKRYPKRSAFFAHNFTRIMTKTCAAQDIGAEAALLCVVIAHLEDTKRYTGPVTFFNEQLYPLLGIATWKRLKRMRDLAVEFGWLHYEEPSRGSRSPGVYWATIPPHLDGISGEFLDEQAWESEQYKAGFKAGSEQKLIAQKHLSSQELIAPSGISNGDQLGDQTGINREVKEGSTDITIYPIPNPIPNPIPFSKDESNPDFAAFLKDPWIFEAEFIARWNSLEGKTRYGSKQLDDNSMTTKLEDMLRKGLNWRAAMAKFPLPMYAGGSWTPNMKWFLKPGTIREILDGNYDRAIGGKGASAAGRVGAGQRYDPSTDGKPADF